METTKKSNKKRIFPIILSLVLLAALGFGIKEYIYLQHNVDTDDAQVDGDIVPVVSRASGYVAEILFEEHQLVKKGDVLVKLDDRDYQVKVKQAQAALDAAIANVGVSKSTVLSTQANIETAKSAIESAKIRVWKATQDYNRNKNLMDDKAITQQQFDAVKAEKETAEAQLASAEAQYGVVLKQVGTSETQVTAASSNIAARQADLDYANLQLSYTTIMAPTTGIASKKNIQPGQLVQNGQNLFAIVNDSNIYVTANFKETQLERMKIGNKVTVIVDAFPDEPIEAEIYTLSPATGAKFALLPPDNATGNYVKVVQRVPVKIKLNVSKDVLRKLRPGMSVKVTVHIG